MKQLRIIPLLLVGLLAFYVVLQEFRVIDTRDKLPPPPEVKEGQAPKLRFLTRYGYFSPEIMAQAQEALGAEIVPSFYRSDDECLRLLDSGAVWDLILVPDHIALKLDRLNASDDIEYGHIPNHRNMVLGMPISQDMGALFRCAVPYFYTSMGLGYDPNLVGSLPTRWSSLFAPENAQLMRGHLGLLNDARRTLGIALIALGKSPNTQDPAEIKQAAELVRQCLGTMATMERLADPLQGGADFLAHQVSERRLFLTMVTSSAISREMATNPALRFSSPAEGTLLLIDCLVIPRKTENRVLAEDCINYLLQPKISAQVTNESGYATTNQAATAYFSPYLYHGPAFATPTGRQFFYLQDVNGAESAYRDAWREVLAYYQARVVPVLDRQVGFYPVFLESNDAKPESNDAKPQSTDAKP